MSVLKIRVEGASADERAILVKSLEPAIGAALADMGVLFDNLYVEVEAPACTCQYVHGDDPRCPWHGDGKMKDCDCKGGMHRDDCPVLQAQVAAREKLEAEEPGDVVQVLDGLQPASEPIRTCDTCGDRAIRVKPGDPCTRCVKGTYR